MGSRECAPLTFLWVGYRANDVLSSWVGSTHWRKTTSDPFGCLVRPGSGGHHLSEKEKSERGVIAHINSWELHGPKFVPENERASSIVDVFGGLKWPTWSRYRA